LLLPRMLKKSTALRVGVKALHNTGTHVRLSCGRPVLPWRTFCLDSDAARSFVTTLPLLPTRKWAKPIRTAQEGNLPSRERADPVKMKAGQLGKHRNLRVIRTTSPHIATAAFRRSRANPSGKLMPTGTAEFMIERQRWEVQGFFSTKFPDAIALCSLSAECYQIQGEPVLGYRL